MPRGKLLTEHEKGQIVAFRKTGLGLRVIAREIGRSHKVVKNFCDDMENYGTRKSSGRPKKLTKRDERRILNEASNSTKTLRQIAASIPTDVSKQTIWRTIKASDTIVRSKLLTTPRLLARHKAQRLDFAKENMNRDWKLVRKSSVVFLFQDCYLFLL